MTAQHEQHLLASTERALLQRIATAQSAGRAPSLVAGVIRDSTLVWSGGYGDVGSANDTVATNDSAQISVQISAAPAPPAVPVNTTPPDSGSGGGGGTLDWLVLAVLGGARTSTALRRIRST